MTVGELARRAGVRPSTIRYYEELGLVPAPPRRSGWRDFDGDALAHLAVVQFARSCGFTLKETRQLVKGFSTPTPLPARWNTLARKKTAEMDAAIERARMMKELLARISRCKCETLTECGRRMLRTRASSLDPLR
jgi:MerR family transcriptional regulator, redox-sensitive transcriptional activator SoxR